MYLNENTKIEKFIVHSVGNSGLEEGIYLSDQLINLSDEVEEQFNRFFNSSFKSDDQYRFFHESELTLNAVFSFVKQIFDYPETFVEQSRHLARHLYEQSSHPRIKGGEFYIATLNDCDINGQTCNAIALFKSENKETYLKVKPMAGSFDINTDDGINLRKLDKGCLIFNIEVENGFIVTVVDNLNRGNDAVYWKDGFLKVLQRGTSYSHTAEMMRVCQNYINAEFPQTFEVNKADQADLMNRSLSFFKENDSFILEEFTDQVIAQPELIESFNSYREKFEDENQIELPDQFEISDQAVKKQAKGLKTVIKLDKNFHIYIHGDRHLITKGYDEVTQKHYYQLFFDEEL